MFKKLRNKFDSNSNSSNSNSSSSYNSARPRGEAAGYYGASSGSAAGGYAPPAGPPPPQTGSYGQQQQQQQFYAPPPGAPPGAPSEKDLAPLKRFDTVLLIDDSESMEMFWDDQVRQALVGVVTEAVKWDQDGIDVYFFNNQRVANNVNNPQAIIDLFNSVRPYRSTPTATALKRITEPYMQKLEASKANPSAYPRPKPLNILCLTDGAPNRGEDPEPVIVDLARRLDAIHAPLTAVGIQFMQVGEDGEAREALQHLDDNLDNVHHVRDIVDTVVTNSTEPVTAQTIVKVLLGAVNRKIDAREQ